MAMVVIANEDVVRDVIFDKYRNVGAFQLGKGKGAATNAAGREIEFEKLNFLPDDDTVNAIKNGDMKLKKVINAAIKAIRKPKMENATIGLGVTQLITLITSDRKAKKGIPVIAFITDESDPERNKIMVKFIQAILGEFGIKALTKKKTIKKIFKKKKAAREKVAAYCRKAKNGCNLSQHGVAVKKMNYIFYEMELRQSAMQGMDLSDLDRDAATACTKTLINTYTANNLRFIKKETAKKLAKKDRAAAKAYDSLRDILQIINPKLKLPKVKYGQKKKKGKAVGPKTDVKKFKKFFTKRANRPLLLLVYGHTLALLLGVEIGSKEYLTHMRGVCSVFKADFSKQFEAAVKEYVKGSAPAAK